MSPNHNRVYRGYEAQRIVAEAMRRDGWPYAEPVGAGRPGKDITGTPGLALEVKARAGFDPLTALRQAEAYAGDDWPCVVLRCNGQGPAAVDDYPAIMRFWRLRRLFRLAGYGEPL